MHHHRPRDSQAEHSRTTGLDANVAITTVNITEAIIDQRMPQFHAAQCFSILRQAFLEREFWFRGGLNDGRRAVFAGLPRKPDRLSLSSNIICLHQDEDA